MSLKYKILIIVTPSIFILDLITKWLIRSKMAMGEAISVIPGYFDIVHVANKGAAFGMLAATCASFRIPFFYAVTAIAVIVIVVMLVKLPANDRFLSLVFSLILGGIAGNVLDRVRFGEVTDFLSFHIHDKIIDTVILGYRLHFRLEWPAFNVADIAITVAMVMLVWSLFRADVIGRKTDDK